MAAFGNAFQQDVDFQPQAVPTAVFALVNESKFKSCGQVSQNFVAVFGLAKNNDFVVLDYFGQHPPHVVAEIEKGNYKTNFHVGEL